MRNFSTSPASRENDVLAVADFLRLSGARKILATEDTEITGGF
jgi:hypothetical protein